jgi:hypothetical protein
MGVSKEDYIMVGIDIIEQIKKMEEEDFERLEFQISKSDEIEMIYDGMSSEYCVIGTVLRKVNECGIAKPFSIHYINLDDTTRDVDREITRIAGGMIERFPFDINLIAFSHYH